MLVTRSQTFFAVAAITTVTSLSGCAGSNADNATSNQPPGSSSSTAPSGGAGPSSPPPSTPAEPSASSDTANYCDKLPKADIDALLGSSGWAFNGGKSFCDAVQSTPEGEKVTFWNLRLRMGTGTPPNYDETLGFIKAASCGAGGISTPLLGDNAYLDASCYERSFKAELIMAKGAEVYQVFYSGSLTLKVPRDTVVAALTRIAEAGAS